MTLTRRSIQHEAVKAGTTRAEDDWGATHNQRPIPFWSRQEPPEGPVDATICGGLLLVSALDSFTSDASQRQGENDPTDWIPAQCQTATFGVAVAGRPQPCDQI